MEITLEEAARYLREAQSIVITAHQNPDGDAIGSILGLMHILRPMGKDVQVLLDDDVPRTLMMLPGTDEIRRPAGTVEADLLVVLDAEQDRIGKVPDAVKARDVLNIDHHRTNTRNAPLLYLDASRAATAEIIYELAKELGREFTQESAMCIYTGMATDSGFFRYSCTKPFTMRAAAELMEHGVQPSVISEALEQKPYALVQGLAKAMQSIELFADGRIGGMFLDYELTSSLESTEGFVDYARVIEGVDVAVLVKEKEDEGKRFCRVSMRSRDTDVSAVAASFGGGGHIRAAGCTLKMPLAEAKETILAALVKAVGA